MTGSIIFKMILKYAYVHINSKRKLWILGVESEGHKKLTS